MRLSELAEAAAILAKYAPTEEDQYALCVEHDEIWLGSTEWSISDVDRARLEELGFDIDEDNQNYHQFT